MKNSIFNMLKSTLFLLLLTGFLFSCEKEDVTTITDSNLQNGNELAQVHDDHDCSTEVAFPGRTGTMIPFQVGGETYEVEEIDGKYVFGGDMILTRDQINQSQERGAGITSIARYWPNSIVYFEIRNDLPNQQRVRDAVTHWNDNTNLVLIESATAANRIRFIPSSGCWSFVGMQGGVQNIGLSNGCSTGNTIHEIGHAIGLFHEHTGPTRNTFVNILWGNILPGRENNFQSCSSCYSASSFDFGSIMMYSSFAFSRNGNPTITRKNGTTFGSQRNALSVRDIQQVNDMYEPACSFTSDDNPIEMASKTAMQGLSLYLSNTNEGYQKEVQHLLINNYKELADILSTDAAAQKAFSGFIKANSSLIESTFGRNSEATLVTATNITAASDLLNKLANGTTDQELKNGLTKLEGKIKDLSNKPLKQGFKDLDQLSNN